MTPIPGQSKDQGGARWRAFETPLFNCVALIGMGLIGSSLALAMRRSGAAGRIVGVEPNDAAREEAGALGLCDRIYASAAEAVADADFVCLSAPVGATAAIGAAIGPYLKPGAIVSDVGSVKGAVIDALAPLLPAHAHFVPAHPVAGAESSGPAAGIAEMFDNRWCVLTPIEGGDREAVEKVRTLWRALGSDVEEMTAAHHDRVVAVVSHLPHLIAYTIVGTASDLEEVTRSEVIKYSAGGFRDFTRIAASDPVMWRDVFLTNKEAVLELLGRFTEDLIRLQRAIRWGEGETLEAHFAQTRDIRRGIVEFGQDIAAPDFGRRSGETMGSGAKTGDRAYKTGGLNGVKALGWIIGHALTALTATLAVLAVLPADPSRVSGDDARPSVISDPVEAAAIASDAAAALEIESGQGGAEDEAASVCRKRSNGPRPGAGSGRRAKRRRCRGGRGRDRFAWLGRRAKRL